METYSYVVVYRNLKGEKKEFRPHLKYPNTQRMLALLPVFITKPIYGIKIKPKKFSRGTSEE